MNPHNKLTIDTFVTRSQTIHSNKYTYEKVEYVNIKVKVLITCPIHGDFLQAPGDHLKGHGCKACKSDKQSKRQTSNNEKFISKALNVHEGLYKYDKVEYINSKSPVVITCPTHGDFHQSPSDHLKGRGCPTCGSLVPGVGWSYSSWERAGNLSKQFVGFQLYIVELWSDTEKFLKVGKTYTSIATRLRNLPYEYKVLHVLQGSALYVSNLETALHSKLENDHYTPAVSFGGVNECYPSTYLQKLLTTIEQIDNDRTNNSNL